jgi:flagellar biosynthesis chaperone FliJ
LTGKATSLTSSATAAADKIKTLENKIVGLQSTLVSAKQSGAPSAEVQALQQQVAELTAALAVAQQEHIAAAQAAADAHREEMGLLQMQINQLVEAMQGAQAAGSNDQVAALQAQVAQLQEALSVAGASAEAEEAAAEETAEEASSLQPWHEQYRTWLIVGGGVALLGAVYYFFLRPRQAMRLPVPTSPASPSGLAANPSRKKGIRIRSYSYRHPKTGKIVRVKGHIKKAPKSGKK